MTQLLVVGVIHQNWSDGAIVAHPFKLSDRLTRSCNKATRFKVLRGKHVLETALAWQAEMIAIPYVQPSDVAEAVGLSAIRVRQILRFAVLHPQIRKAILELRPKQAKKRFPERLLRQWTPLGQSEQLNRFKQYMA